MAWRKRSSGAAYAVEKSSFVRWTEWLINGTATLIAFWFGWLLLRDIKADAILTPLAADVLWRLTLVLYYWSWIAGTRADTRIQALAYVSFPGPAPSLLCFSMYLRSAHTPSRYRRS